MEKSDGGVEMTDEPATADAPPVPSAVAQDGVAHAGPSRVTPPPTTVSLSDVQPTRRAFSIASPKPKQPVPEWVPQDNYNVAAEYPGSPPKISMPLETDYTLTLPRLPPIPAHASQKRRRKLSKSDPSERRKDLGYLQIEYKLNPVSGALSKSTKCVLTTDWKIAAAEIRHVRAMERVDSKKNSGRWSLRQPKKLRHPPVPKAHWDYLLDEMVSWSSCSTRVCMY